MNKKFLSAMAICSILASTVAPTCSVWADNSNQSSSSSHVSLGTNKVVANSASSSSSSSESSNIAPVSPVKKVVPQKNRRNPIGKVVRLASGAYTVYNIYHKNAFGGNFGFAKEHARSAAKDIEGKVSCPDQLPNKLCAAEKWAARAVGYAKGFTGAEMCILTDYNLCSESTKNSAIEYKVNLNRNLNEVQ